MSYVLPVGRPAIMGILNVTPDSFSDGGSFFEIEKAVEHAVRMVQEGADLIDVGGESTRPGAEAISEEEEISRVNPVIERLVDQGIIVSIDTSKASVASAAIQAGAQIVNDVCAGVDPEMATVCARANVPVCLMHMKGDPRTMQQNPHYEDVVAEIRAYLLDRAHWFESAGVPKSSIWLDPGIGFGKTVQHNLSLLKHLSAFVELGYPILIGVSRKSFLGKLIGTESAPAPLEERIEAGLAAQVLAQAAGVRVIRTHDVLAANRAATLTSAILGAE
ncbi:MAG: dihydropteroate synthase [Fimbriimonadaceae bacterium]|nr:dihydropteroate synthase [Fimbriimonadaceae bacterium]